MARFSGMRTTSGVTTSPGPSTVLHVPHASVTIPADVRPTYGLSGAVLKLELLRMTDRYTDELFALEPALATAVVFPVSRLVVDSERFLDDAMEPMVARGMGVLYTHTSQRTPLRPPPSPTEREQLLAQWYHPHHARLTEAVEAVLLNRGTCLVIDCHSFASAPLPYELDQSPDRPEICLGTDAFHTPSELVEVARRAFEEAGFSVALDRPFAGALVPLRYYQRAPRVRALMVEVNRGLYMDEATGARLEGFAGVQLRLAQVLRRVIAFAEKLP
ncbi:MAG TPA: N-formylglutamate amidohydrolase [Gemmatimonadales bacterium]